MKVKDLIRELKKIDGNLELDFILKEKRTTSMATKCFDVKKKLFLEDIKDNKLIFIISFDEDEKLFDNDISIFDGDYFDDGVNV